jgi:RNA polymerase-binding transcription factor DksA
MAAKKAVKKPVAKPASKTPPAKKPEVKKPTAKPVAKAPAKPAKPAAKPAKPAAKPAKPAAKLTKPAAKLTKPAAKPVKPAAKPVKPAAKPAKPAAKAPDKAITKAPSKPAPAPVAVKKAAASVKAAPTPAPVVAAKPKKVFVPPTKKFTPIAETPTIVVEPITDPKFIAFAEKQKQRLLDLRDDIVDAMTGSAREAIRSSPEGSDASGSGMHQGDAGSDAYDRDFALSVLAKDQDALYEIEEALLRIKKHTYGICEMSGKRIPIARLEAIPFARLTVECQAQWEKEYGTKKFRPSGSVGFSGGGIFDDDEDSDTISLDEDED